MLSLEQMRELIAKGELKPLTDEESKNFKARIMLYSITGCPMCIRVKSVLKELNLPFYDVNFDIFPGERMKVKALLGGRAFTVPQIFFNENYIGGLNPLMNLLEDTKKWEQIVEMLQEVEPPEAAPKPPTQHEAVMPINLEDAFECSQDEYGDLMNILSTSGEVVKKSVKFSCLREERNVFAGSELVLWLMRRSEVCVLRLFWYFLQFRSIDSSSASCRDRQRVPRAWFHRLHRPNRHRRRLLLRIRAEESRWRFL